MTQFPLDISKEVRIDKAVLIKRDKVSVALLKSDQLAGHYKPRIIQRFDDFRRRPHPLWKYRFTPDLPTLTCNGVVANTKLKEDDIPLDEHGNVIIRRGTIDAKGQEIVLGREMHYVDWRNRQKASVYRVYEASWEKVVRKGKEEDFCRWQPVKDFERLEDAQQWARERAAHLETST